MKEQNCRKAEEALAACNAQGQEALLKAKAQHEREIAEHYRKLGLEKERVKAAVQDLTTKQAQQEEAFASSVLELEGIMKQLVRKKRERDERNVTSMMLSQLAQEKSSPASPVVRSVQTGKAGSRGSNTSNSSAHKRHTKRTFHDDPDPHPFLS